LCFKNTQIRAKSFPLIIGSGVEGHVTTFMLLFAIVIISRTLEHTLLFARSVKSGFHEITGGQQYTSIHPQLNAASENHASYTCYEIRGLRAIPRNETTIATLGSYEVR
jgi:hypothetical protein